jgi:hypothetical protein
MTCQSALEQLLDAEPSEFSAKNPTALGGHLRGCARCRRVATQLMLDTQGLAVAMAAAAPARRSSRYVRQVTMVPAVALAVIVFAVALRTRPEMASPPVVARVPAVIEQHTPPVTASPSPSPNVNAPGTREARHVRHEPKAFAAAVPIAPVKLARVEPMAPVASVSPSGVSVTTPSGTRAVVLQTSDPRVVVVWLY